MSEFKITRRIGEAAEVQEQGQGDAETSPGPIQKESAQPSAQLGTIASDLIGTMSAPSDHAIAQAETESTSTSENAGQEDDFGHAFDPAVHAIDENGNPQKTPTGRWAKIRKARGGSVLRVATSKPENVLPVMGKQEAAARGGGVAAANLLIVCGIALGGDEWQPRKDDKSGLDEKAMLEGAFADYFVATGKTDLPPGWALATAIGFYVAPRFTMPKTQSRVSRVKSWIVAKYVNWKQRGKGVRVKPAMDQE